MPPRHIPTRITQTWRCQISLYQASFSWFADTWLITVHMWSTAACLAKCRQLMDQPAAVQAHGRALAGAHWLVQQLMQREVLEVLVMQLAQLSPEAHRATRTCG